MNDSNEHAGEQTTSLQSASEHLVELASSKQLVLLGDQIGISQHVSFVAQILPELHEAGVRNLAWEFTNSRAQQQLDGLLSADEWNDVVCTELFVDLMGIGFTYREYAEVVKAAWSLNRTLESSASAFRIIGLGIPTYVEDPELLDGRSASELELRNWWMGGHYRDVAAFHMANILTNEILRTGERALVLVSSERSTTNFVQWDDGLPTVSVGNLLYRWVGEGVARAVFHGAIADSMAVERVEALVAAAPENPETFGIALNLATLGSVGLNEVVGSVDGVDTSLRLRDIADSYLWIAGVDDWEPCELIPDVITSKNLDHIEARYRALDPQAEPWTQTELEQIRAEGQAKLADSWVKLPVKEEPPSKRSRFGRRRS
mgnify:CR=1 FL=1|tara:strand:- start:3600 stop:4724 length:1125 start_codon:yes stop_codon:yes gene_type:complete